MFAPRQSSRFSAIVAALACFIFALGVRDTPERPLPSPPPARGPTVSEFHSTLTVEVLAASTLAVQRLTLGARAVSRGSDAGNAISSTAGAGGDGAEVANAGSGGEGQAAESQPLAGATVRVFWNDLGNFRLVGTAQTNEQGRTRLTSLPRGVLWVIAEAPGRARSSTQLVMDEDERVAALSLLLAQDLSLTVLDEQGLPLENATLLVTANDPLPHGALTDRNGFAKVTRLGPGPYRIKASARGYESVQLAHVLTATTLRLRRLGALLVRVEDHEQMPVADATVTLSGTSLWPARQVTTNAQGLVNVRGLLPGSFDLRARKGSLISPTELGIVLGRGEERSITLRLAEGRFVTVWVTDGEEEPALPVANADVVVAESGLSAFPERGRTEIDGKVTLGPFEPGALSASATARDFVGTSVVSVPEDGVLPLRIPLRRGGHRKGTGRRYLRSPDCRGEYRDRGYRFYGPANRGNPEDA